MRTNPTTANSASLIRNGYEFIQSNLDLISEAREFIFLHTYIFEEDETTKPIIKELLVAAKRKVKIYILFDAYGSQSFPSDTIEEFQKAGIRFHFFTPFFHFYHVARRMHQKLLLVDNKKAIVGGINLARRFNNPDQEQPWLDFSMLIEGEEVHNIYLKSLRHYLKYFAHDKANLLNFKTLSHRTNEQFLTKSIENDWIFQYREITESYIHAIKNADNRIVIMATYFLPGKKLLKNLKKAKQKGVQVILIFGAFSDHKIVQAAERYFFDWYIRCGFEIYIWDKSIVHGKLALIDEGWVSIGSYNHNFLSKFGNCELNLEVINKEFNKTVEKEVHSILKSCKKVETSDLNEYSELAGFLTYILLNFLTLFSLIFLYRQSDEEKENIAR